MSENEEKIDYLEVDDTIPGQNYVCLSFVSPETMIEKKEKRLSKIGPGASTRR